MAIGVKETVDDVRVGRLVRLTQSTEADYELFVEWLSPDGQIASLTGDQSEEVTVDALRSAVASGSRYCTIRSLDGRALGMVKFHRIGGDSSTIFEISGAIGGDGLWSRGYGAEGFGMLIEHLFDDLGAHRLQFRVGLFNRAMLEMVMRLKFFVLEGVLRERLLFEGQYYDLAIWAMLRSEYESLFVRGEWASGLRAAAAGTESPEQAASREFLRNYLRGDVITSLNMLEK